MCFIPGLDPFTLLGLGSAAAASSGAAAGASGVATALTALSTGLGVVGSVVGGIQGKQTADYNAEVAKNNAQAAKQEAAYEAQMTREQVQRVKGAQRAAGASSGLNIDSGTPVAVLGDTAKQGELDVLAQLYRGNVAATGYMNQAKQFKAEGKSAMASGFINAGTSLVGGLSQYAKQRRLMI